MTIRTAQGTPQAPEQAQAHAQASPTGAHTQSQSTSARESSTVVNWVLLDMAAVQLDWECDRLRLERLDEGQVRALGDPGQAFGMLADMEARCGMDVAEARQLLMRAHGVTEYGARVLELEAIGYTTSDAQAVADVEGLED